MLDVLAERGIKATFFVVGEQLREHRALAERAHAEGHWIGNHTLTHPRPLGASPQARHEIEAVELGELAHPDKLFRPSGAGGDLEPGLLNREAVDTLVAGGYTCVLWNAVPGDWEDPDGWVDRALEQVAAARLDAARAARRARRGGAETGGVPRPRRGHVPAGLPARVCADPRRADHRVAGGADLAAQQQRQRHQITLRRSRGD